MVSILTFRGLKEIWKIPTATICVGDIQKHCYPEMANLSARNKGIMLCKPEAQSVTGQLEGKQGREMTSICAVGRQSLTLSCAAGPGALGGQATMGQC